MRPATENAMFSSYFDALEPGDRFETRPRTITENDIMAFAALTRDWHPQHTDASWAGSSQFGERIAHGMLIISYAIGLVPFDPDRVIAMRRLGEAKFRAPVRIGESIHVEGEVRKLSAVAPTAGLVKCHWAIVNQDGKTVVRMDVDVLWRRRDAFADQVDGSDADWGLPVETGPMVVPL